MKKIIAFSLWGDNKVYTYGTIENVILAKELYPGWVVKIHYNETVPENVINLLKKYDNVELIKHEGNQKKASNTLWRFEELFSDNIIIVRDTDSRLNIREKAAVDEWLASDKDFHIMRDHKHHLVSILAGAFGARNGICNTLCSFNNTINYNICPYTFFEGSNVFNLFKQSLNEQNDTYMIDQKFLYHYVYPKILFNTVVHASYNKYEPFAKDFPKTNYDGFIGEVITSTPNASNLLGDTKQDFERIGQYE